MGKLPKKSLMKALRRYCRPVAYTAIAIGTVWTASLMMDIAGRAASVSNVEDLRFAFSVLVAGLLLGAFAYWE